LRVFMQTRADSNDPFEDREISRDRAPPPYDSFPATFDDHFQRTRDQHRKRRRALHFLSCVLILPQTVLDEARVNIQRDVRRMFG